MQFKLVNASMTRIAQTTELVLTTSVRILVRGPSLPAARMPNVRPHFTGLSAGVLLVGQGILMKSASNVGSVKNLGGC